jgi:hypothetical protein
MTITIPTLEDSVRQLEATVRFEALDCWSPAAFSFALQVDKGWTAKFVWKGRTLTAKAGTIEEAAAKLVGLTGQRNCIDAQVRA